MNQTVRSRFIDLRDYGGCVVDNTVIQRSIDLNELNIDGVLNVYVHGRIVSFNYNTTNKKLTMFNFPTGHNHMVLHYFSIIEDRDNKIETILNETI